MIFTDPEELVSKGESLQNSQKMRVLSSIFTKYVQ